MATRPAIDEAKLNEFVGKFAGDLGAVLHAATVLIGDKLGLYKAMADDEPLTAQELAERTGTDERYMREWLSAQVASGYVEYDPDTDRFRLPAEQAFALTNEHNPLFVPGGLQVAASTIKDVGTVAEAIRTGKGVGWHEHHHDLFEGTERFFRPNYIGNLISSWIPALEGVEDKLRAGAKVADIGCGHGASTIILAQEYPNSTFFGFDYHEPSIAAARKAASEAGVTDRCSFEVASAKEYPGEGYDLVAVFHALHDMGDPVGAAAHVLESLEPDGTWMVVEPYASDRLEDNLNPVGRIFYSASTTICVPASKDQEMSLALGAQA
ncbi:MAG: methyltransferase domain-containing protein, partial [Actinomycetota bacterium]|nr:methyltransferase domain-containing protein [Actinomycetota bacterium]